MSPENAKAFAAAMEEFARAWMVDMGMDPEKHIRAAIDYIEATVRDCPDEPELIATRIDEYLTRQRKLDESSRVDDETWLARWMRNA